MLTTVAAFREPWEAHMFCSRLKAEGIPAFVSHEYHVGNAWDLSVLLGGVKVQVLRDHLQEARSVDRLCRDGAFKVLLERELGDLDDVRCPKCGCTEYSKRRPFLRAVAAVSISLFCGTVFPPLGWVHSCGKCDTEYTAPLRTGSAKKWSMIFAAIGCEMLVLIALSVLVRIAHSTDYWFVLAIVATILAALGVTRWIAGMAPARE